MVVGVGGYSVGFKKFLGERSKLLTTLAFIASIIIALSFYWKSYALASTLNVDLDQVKYVSDETWYVTASRNMLVAMGYSLRSEVNGTLYATLFFPDNTTLEGYIEKAGLYGVKIVSKYNKITAVSVRGSPEEIEYSMRESRVLKVIWGYPYPDRENIDSYYNLEHPPLGKYFIALSMLVFGDLPVYWRLPGVIAGSIIIVLAFIIGLRLSGPIGGLLASIVLYFDTLLLNMSSIAMLEIYVMLFLTLTLLFLVYRKPILASIALGLAASVKLSGLFVTIPLYIIAKREGYDSLRAYLLAFIIPLITIGLMCFPLYPVFGVSNVITSLVSSIGWHTSIKHKLTEGPPVSAPWEWFYNANPFYFHFNPDLAAIVNPPIYIGALIVALLLLGATLSKKYKVQGYPPLFFTFILLGYIVMYVLGGRTQYSYYVSLLTPLTATILSQLLSVVGEPCILFLSLSHLSTFLKRELSFYWLPEKFRNREFQVIIATALTFWFLSFMLHMPNSSVKLGEPSFYSDYMAVYGEYISKNPIGIPYFSYYFNRPPLIGIIAFIGGLAGEFGELVRGSIGGIASYYLYNSLLSLLATIWIATMLWELHVKFKFKTLSPLLFVTPTFIMFSCYDWTIIASALTLYGYSCFLSGKVKEGITGIALASTINPYIIVVAIIVWALRLIGTRALMYFVLVFTTLNLPLLLNFEYLTMAYKRFIDWYSEGSLWILLPENFKPPYFTLLIYLVGMLLSLILTFKFRSVNVKSSKFTVVIWASLSLSLVLSDVFRPQYALLIHVFYFLTPTLHLPLFYLFEILNVGIIVFWWSQETWSQLMFRTSVVEGYSISSIVGWASIIRNIVLLVLIWKSLRAKTATPQSLQSL